MTNSEPVQFQSSAPCICTPATAAGVMVPHPHCPAHGTPKVTMTVSAGPSPEGAGSPERIAEDGAMAEILDICLAADMGQMWRLDALKKIQAIAERRAGEAREGAAALRTLIAQWRQEIQDRAGQGCGCYGRSTQLRICADQLDALLTGSAGSIRAGGETPQPDSSTPKE